MLVPALHEKAAVYLTISLDNVFFIVMMLAFSVGLHNRAARTIPPPRAHDFTLLLLQRFVWSTICSCSCIHAIGIVLDFLHVIVGR